MAENIRKHPRSLFGPTVDIRIGAVLDLRFDEGSQQSRMLQ